MEPGGAALGSLASRFSFTLPSPDSSRKNVNAIGNLCAVSKGLSAASVAFSLREMGRAPEPDVCTNTYSCPGLGSEMISTSATVNVQVSVTAATSIL